MPKLPSKQNAKMFALEFSTSEKLRREIFIKLLNHLKAGYSIDCFGPLSEISIKEALRTYPLEFNLDDIENAMREAKEGWEKIGRMQAMGTCLGNSRSWFYNMANRYGWSDKQKVETSGSQAVQVSIVNYSRPKPAVDDADTLDAT